MRSAEQGGRLVARKFLMRRRVTIDGVLPDLIDDETRAAAGIDDGAWLPN